MLNEFRKTIVKVLHLRSVVGYNSLVFALKKTPLIGKILPDRLYKMTFLKVIYWVLHVVREVFALFLTKMAGISLVYLASLAVVSLYKAAERLGDMSVKYAFGMFSLLFFLVYAFYGVVLNVKIFEKTTEKEYLVFMIRMNAKKLNNTLFAYDLARMLIGYLLIGIIPAVFGVPVWCWLGIPVLAVFIKLFGAGLLAFRYRLKSRHHKLLKGTAAGDFLKLVLIIFPIPPVFIMITGGYYVPAYILLLISAALTVGGILGLNELIKAGPDLHRRALHDGEILEKETVRAAKANTRSFKRIKAKGTVKDSKKGFKFLNALFVKRHFKMLVVKPIVCAFIILAFTLLIVVLSIMEYNEQFGPENCLNMVLLNIRNLILCRGYEDPLTTYVPDSAALFFRNAVQYHLLTVMIPMAISDNSFKSTQAMYINCDNSLMTFSFFKQRKMIMKLFDIRLRQLISFNILPVFAMAFSLNLILFSTGGQEYPFQYLMTFVIIMSMSVIYSTYWLVIYYLFQPFTTTVIVKSGAYNAAYVIVSILLSVIVWFRVHSLVLAAILVVFAALFVFFMRMLVSNKAPKTWKVKV